MSLRDWFITPAPGPAPHDVADEPPPSADDVDTRVDTAAWAPPVNAAPALVAAPAQVAAPPQVAAPLHVAAPPPAAATAHAAAPPRVAAPAQAAPADTPLVRAIASAAVIGRAGEAEPVAAGIALALRGRAPAAAVIVVGERGAPGSDGGTRAARRLASRLDAHGFAGSARGRLAWAYVEPNAARRAALVAGEPVVLAITVPLDSALELALADHDLAIVVARDEHGPLAQIATASLPGPTVTVIKPLPRGLPRLLARYGLRAPTQLQRSHIDTHLSQMRVDL